MTETDGLQPAGAEEAPEPGAAPAPVPAPEPEPEPAAEPAAADAQEAEVTPQEMAPPPETAPQEDQSGRAAELEGELAKIRAAAVKGAKVLLRVCEPHISFSHGGITVGTEPTPVPERALGTLLEAAGEAGVKLEEA